MIDNYFQLEHRHYFVAIIVYLPNKVVKLALYTLNFLHISLTFEQLKDNIMVRVNKLYPVLMLK